MLEKFGNGSNIAESKDYFFFFPQTCFQCLHLLQYLTIEHCDCPSFYRFKRSESAAFYFSFCFLMMINARVTELKPDCWQETLT